MMRPGILEGLFITEGSKVYGAVGRFTLWSLRSKPRQRSNAACLIMYDVCVSYSFYCSITPAAVVNAVSSIRIAPPLVRISL